MSVKRAGLRVEGLIFNIFGIFGAGCAYIYWYFSRDPTGTAALALSGGLGFLIGGYLVFTGRRLGERPQDQDDAEIADGAGELGHFTPGSYYPFFIAASASLVGMGFIFGVWLIILGGLMTLFFVTCLVFENFWHPPVPEN